MTVKVLPPRPPGSHKIRVQEDVSKRSSTITTSQTSVGTTATKITTPVDATNFLLKHLDPGVTLWLGSDDTVTAEGSTAWPLQYNEVMELDQFLADNENSIYGIVDNGSVTVYCMGRYLG